MIDQLMKYKEYLLLLIVPIIVYGASLSNGYNLDDELVIDNRFIGDDLSVIPEIFTENYFTGGEVDFGYRPVVVLSFFLETHFFGVNPTTSHVINLLLYVLLGLCLYHLSLSLSDSRWVSLVAVLLFLVHPLHVEVVASAKNREELLSFLFMSMAALSALRYVSKGNYLWLLGVAVCGILAVLSKKSALPGLLMIPPAIILFRSYRLIDLVSVSVLVLVIVAGLSPFSFDTLVIIMMSSTFFYFLLVGLRQEDAAAYYKAGLERIPWFVLLHLVALIWIVYFPLKWVFVPVGLGILYTFILGNRVAASNFIVLMAMVVGAWAQSEHVVIFSTFVAVWLAYQNKGTRHHQLYNWSVVGVGLILLSWTVLMEFQPMFLFIIAYVGLSVYFVRRANLPRSLFIGYTILTVLILGYLVLMTSNYVLMAAVLLTYSIYFIKDELRLTSTIAMLPYLLVALVLFQNVLLLEVTVWPEERLDITGSEIVDQKSLFRDIGRQLHPTESVFTEDMGINAKTATSVFILGEYLKLHFWPHPLRFYYGFAQITAQTWQGIAVWLYGILYLLLGLSALALLRRWPLYSYGVLFYLACILPFSNLFVPMAGMMGERLAFIASFGICLGLAFVLHKAYLRGAWRWGMITVVALMLVSLSYASYSRSLLWDNKLYLYEHDIQYTDKSAKMNQLLGSLYFDASKVSGNEEHLQYAVYYLNRAKEIYPDYFIYWVILGLAYQQFDYFADAMVHFKRAIELNPEFTDSYFNVAVCAESLGDEQTAIDYYSAFLELEPSNENAYTNFYFLYFKIGQYDEAIALAQEAIGLFPNNPNHHTNLGKILLTMNDIEGAILSFKNAAALNAADPMLYLTLARMLREQGRTDEADYYQEIGDELSASN